MNLDHDTFALRVEARLTARRGVALLLALIVVTIAATLAYSFLASESTSTAIARNIRDSAEARYVAESGLDLAIAYVKATSNWRTARTSGSTWVSNQSFGLGTFTITGTDPVDGDFSNNNIDPLLLTVAGKVGNTVKIAKAALTPKGSGYTTAFSSLGGSVDGQQVATQITVGQSGCLISISLYGDGPTSKNFRLAVYSDSGGEPAALLAQTAVADIGSNTAHWNTLSLSSPPSLQAGTYWLAFCYEHMQETYYYKSTGGQTRFKANNAISKGFTLTWGSSSSSNTQRISIYAAVSPIKYDVAWTQ